MVEAEIVSELVGEHRHGEGAVDPDVDAGGLGEARPSAGRDVREHEDVVLDVRREQLRRHLHDPRHVAGGIDHRVPLAIRERFEDARDTYLRNERALLGWAIFVGWKPA